MNVEVLIRTLQNFDPKTEVKVIAENGLHLPAQAKLVLKDPYDIFNHSSENLEYLVIHHD